MKKTTRQFKTLEGQLLASKNGERTTVSTRCAELDAQMPLYLGVSKSILDYVIFCHQEDSLWPLSEPSVLKKRFDEIFEALKFTKALDSIKAVRKEQTTEIKLQTQSTQFLKADKERADKATDAANALVEKIESYKNQTDTLEQKMEMVTKQQDELFESNQQFQQVLAEVAQLKRDRVVVGEQRERLEKSCTEVLTVSDEELQKQVSEFDERLDERRNHVIELKTKSDESREEMESHRTSYNSAIVQIGQWEAKRDDLTSQKSLKSALIEELTSKYGNSDLDEHKAALKRQFETLKKESLNEETLQEGKITRLSTQLTEKNTQIGHDKNSTVSYESESRRLQDEVDMIPTVEGTIAYEEGVISKLEEELTSLQGKSGSEETRFSDEIRSCDSHVDELNKRLDKCNADLAEFNSKSEKRAEHRILVSEVTKQKGVLKGVQEVVTKKCDEVGVDESEYADKLQSQQKLVNESRDKLNSARDLLADKSSRLSYMSAESLSKDTTLADLTVVINSVIDDVDDYEATVESLTNDLLIATQNRESTMFTARYYETAVKLAKSAQHSCLLCSRDFVGDELDKFLTHVTKKTASLPDTRDQADKEYFDVKADLDGLQGIAGEVREWRMLKESCEKLSEELEALSNQVKEEKSHVEKLEEGLGEEEGRLRELEGMRRVVDELERHKGELLSKEKELSQFELSHQQVISSSDDSSDLPALAKTLNQQIKEGNQKRQGLVDEREALRKEMSKLQGQVAEKKLGLSQQKNQLTKKLGLSQQIQNLKSKIDDCRQRIKSIRSEIEEIEPRLKSLKSELADMKLTNGDKMDDLSEKMEAVQADVSRLGHVTKQISELEGLDVEGKLKSAGESAESAKNQVTTLTKLLSQHQDDIATQEKALIDLKGHQRNLQDNLEVRRLTKEMETIESRVLALDEKQASRDRDEYQQKSAELRNQHSAYSSKQAGLLGEIRQMDSQLVTLNTELKSEFLDVHEKYRTALIMLKTTTVAHDDLGMYSKALDSAIMQYHSLKMNEINAIVDELWKSTYSGTDIDTILIRSESEKGNAKSGNRSYNYRVCMVKGDAELDMRGRCSAGQKVLAAIIIRLALAECFGINCGLIALDEPTTNLDSDNIESLARSLGNIIDARSGQKNFQLIVITHDEKFLTHMAASKHTDHFYRVSRNVRQKSCIEWCPISQIQDS